MGGSNLNSMKKTMKKGFTLVELIVVMAIMGILLVAVMSMTEPATRISKRTSMSDTAYSMSNNVETYIRRALEYADNVWILDEDSVDVSNNKLIVEGAADPCESMVKKFQKAYYENVAVPTTAGDSGTLKFVQGDIYVLHLDNSTGRIERSKYHFNNSSSDAVEAPVKNQVLPEAYFKGDGAKYNIRYALNASVLEKVDDGDKRNESNDPYYNVKAEKDGTPVNSDLVNQALSVIINQGAVPSADADDKPNEFEGPAVLSVAALQFTNISERSNARSRRYIIKADGESDFATQGTTKALNDFAFSDYGYTYAMHNFAGNKSEPVSTKKDIYFVYAYADELKAHG